MSASLPSSYKVKLNQTVIQIINNLKLLQYLTVRASNNTVYGADYVIFTSSLGHLKLNQANLFYPPLTWDNYNKYSAIISTQFGVVEKVFLVFDKPLTSTIKGIEFKLFWDKDIDFLDA